MAGAGYWDGVARRWAAARPQRLWREYSDQLNARLLEGWLPTGREGRLLKTDLFDEASTPGLAPLLARRVRRAVGIDVSPRVLEAASAAPLLRVGADVRHLPFADGSFDRVFSNSTLDHFAELAELARSLGELARVLRPGGELLLTLDNEANPVLALRNALPSALLERTGLVPYRMGRSCRPARLRQLALAAGLDPLEIGSVMHCPRILGVWLSRVLDRVAGARARQAFFACLLAWERLGRWPTRFRTGYFLTLRARRR